jgi:hypothetical protein
MAKPAISLEMDFSDGYEAAGFVRGMTAEMSTDRYLGSVMGMAHTLMAEAFDATMDAMAASNRSAYHHVYEWRMIGVPGGRLWRHAMVGRGTSREATFEWQASKAPILTPEERQSDPLGTNDPMVGVDLESLNLKPRTYFFYWKAPMMEYDLAARVRPRYAKRLFIPTWRAPGNYTFGMETYQEFSSANPQDGSGGPGTVGNFTAAWLGWWNSEAPAMWDNQVRHVIENDIGVMGKEVGRKKRATTSTFTLKTFGGVKDYKFAAFESGRNRAEALVKGKARSYTKASKYINNNGTFGVDVDYGD